MIILPLGDDVEKKNFPTVTLFLIALNVIVSLYEVRLFKEHKTEKQLVEFVNDWGMVPKDVAKGKFVGIVTHMFLHGGPMHLIGNMLVFWAFARTLEDALGPAYFMILFLISGVAGGLAHAYFSWGEAIPLVGASGAIAGIIGAYCFSFGVLTNIRTFVWFFRPFTVNVPTCAYAIFWLASQSLGVFTSDEGGSGVAFMAHFGGFVVGSILMIGFQQVSGRRLVRGRDGSLGIEDLAELDAAIVAGEKERLDSEEAVASIVCNYCHTPLADEDQMADNLWKCPNPTCRQLHIEIESTAMSIGNS